ncbi:cysteine--tRNA ligase [Devosia sp.]|uniref:cysteine--tRNA ligase n=1 Tax=Devosia sp. TaxID=1871048 RepID=UPI0035B18A8C
MGETTRLRLYNTLTRAKEDFVPIDPANVRMYVCGPTVYDFAHIGNARPVIVFDVLFRLLRHLYGAEHVTYVRNITDVDDKINARAVRDFPGLPLNEAIRKVTETTAAQYHKDTAALGALEPTVEPRATDNIAEMQSLIASLIGSRHAYEAAGEVLFSVDSMPDYGKLSGRSLADNVAGARVAVEAHKRNPADFVLWKQSSPEEPGWDSPWGRGRPGWHIECSAMSERYLGKVFDIHAGGLDLIFPHHENEIAQSRCAHGTAVMANYWLHNGFLQVEGQKMSKSLGNFITIHELLETDKFGGRKWPGEVLRLAMLMTHYREPIDFSVKRLEEALGLWTRWTRWISYYPDAPSIVPEAAVQCLCDDLNTPRLFRELSGVSSVAAGTWEGTHPPDGVVHEADRRTAAGKLRGILELLGVSIEAGQAERDDKVTRQMVAARLAALNARDFARADQIRAELLAQGIQLMDYKDEAGQRRTRWEVKR